MALGERGDRLTHAEDKTLELMRKAQQFADSVHKVMYTQLHITHTSFIIHKHNYDNVVYLNVYLYFPNQLTLKYSK